MKWPFRQKIEVSETPEPQETAETLDLTWFKQEEQKTILQRLREWRGTPMVMTLLLATKIAGVLGDYSEKTVEDVKEELSDKEVTKFDERGREADLELARLDPGQALVELQRIRHESYGPEILKAMAVADPEFFQGQLNEFYDPEAPVGLQAAAEIAIKLDPRYAIDAKETPRLPELLAASTDPDIEWIERIDDLEAKKNARRDAATLLQDIHDGKLDPQEAVTLVEQDSEGWTDRLIAIRAMPEPLAAHAIDRKLTIVAVTSISEMNNLHEEPSAERFKCLEGLEPAELYTILAYGSDDAYPSTFNGTYDHLLRAMKERRESGDVLLDSVGNNHMRAFVKASLQYGRLNDFLSTMPQGAQEKLLREFVSGLDQQANVSEEAAVVADALRLVHEPNLHEVIKDAVASEYKRVSAGGNEKGKAAYGILSRILDRNATWLETGTDQFEVPENSEVSSRELENEDGVVIERYFFYNDEDGQSSFGNFLSRFEGKAGWKVEKHKEYVTIVSTGNERKVKIYANRPAFETSEDAEQPDIVGNLMKQEGAEPTVVVHRGHVYHNDQTIAHIPESARIVVLGSCGGYMSIEQVLERSPGAHIISTQGTGTKLVNDTMLGRLDGYIATQDQFTWEQLWGDVGKQLGNNADFADYVRPDQNFYAKFMYTYHQLTRTI